MSQSTLPPASSPAGGLAGKLAARPLIRVVGLAVLLVAGGAGAFVLVSGNSDDPGTAGPAASRPAVSTGPSGPPITTSPTATPSGGQLAVATRNPFLGPASTATTTTSAASSTTGSSTTGSSTTSSSTTRSSTTSSSTTTTRRTRSTTTTRTTTTTTFGSDKNWVVVAQALTQDDDGNFAATLNIHNGSGSARCGVFYLDVYRGTSHLGRMRGDAPGPPPCRVPAGGNAVVTFDSVIPWESANISVVFSSTF